MRTIGIELKVTTPEVQLRPCKQPEDAVGMKCGWASGCLRLLDIKARSGNFGLSPLFPLINCKIPAGAQEYCSHPGLLLLCHDGMKRMKRRFS